MTLTLFAPWKPFLSRQWFLSLYWGRAPWFCWSKASSSLAFCNASFSSSSSFSCFCWAEWAASFLPKRVIRCYRFITDHSMKGRQVWDSTTNRKKWLTEYFHFIEKKILGGGIYSSAYHNKASSKQSSQLYWIILVLYVEQLLSCNKRYCHKATLFFEYFHKAIKPFTLNTTQIINWLFLHNQEVKRRQHFKILKPKPLSQALHPKPLICLLQ